VAVEWRGRTWDAPGCGLPRVHRLFMETEPLDISRLPMEVAPTAHYTTGGVMVQCAAPTGWAVTR
jgi:aspartate oxidase